MKEEILRYIQGRMPLIIIDTREIERAAREIYYAVEYFNNNIDKYDADEFIKEKGLDVFMFTTFNGWINLSGSPVEREFEVDRALEKVIGLSPGVYIVPILDYFQDTFLRPKITSILLDFHRRLETEAKYIVMVGNSSLIPEEVKIVSGFIDMKLPSKEEIELFLRETIPTLLGKRIKTKYNKLAEACSGLTLAEIEIITKSMLIDLKGKLSLKYMMNAKAEVVKKSGLLEVIQTEEDLNAVGGMCKLKEWIKEVKAIYENIQEAKEFGIPIPKGTLLTGISGCGKSLFAKAIATDMKMPLYRLDVGRLMGSLVGETERNTRELFKLIESVSPCVILLDEIEKMFSGMSASDRTDGGVVARMIGNFLYFMEERECPAFFIATANDISKLPPELLRKGRWDEIWFIDLPDEKERLEIFKIHINKTGRKSENVFTPRNKIAKELIRKTHGFTGAEIEQVVISALRKCFLNNKKELTAKDLYEAATQIVPMSKMNSSTIENLRRWAKTNARIANQKEQIKPQKQTVILNMNEGRA